MKKSTESRDQKPAAEDSPRPPSPPLVVRFASVDHPADAAAAVRKVPLALVDEPATVFRP